MPPGCSGGPALCGGRAVGVAFLGLEQSVGALVPAQVVARFLRDFETRRRYTQFGFVPFWVQLLETADIRPFFGVEGGRQGVRVVKIHDSAKVCVGLRDGALVPGG